MIKRSAPSWVPPLVALCVIAPPALALAQTRDEQQAAEQAEKAKNLHPYVPTKAEQRIASVERILTRRPAVYTFFGNVLPGGWMALGPGFRKRVSETGLFDIHGAWSLKNYKLVDTSLGLPPVADGRVRFSIRSSWLDAPKVKFFGVGPDSIAANESQYSYQATTVGADAQVRAARFLTLGGGLDHVGFEADQPSGGSRPILLAFVNAAGLSAEPTYARSRLFAEFDSRQSPGYTTSGGRYRLEYSNYDERSSGPFSFERLDVEANQFVPILRANWVIALRALASFTHTDAGQTIPYFLLPDLGGGRQLRGYPSWRFRDRNRMLLTGEYRWTAGQFVDMALFLDAGKVAPTRHDLDFHDLTTTYGFGVRFHTPIATPIRIDVARTHGEGTSLILAVVPAF